MKTLRRVWLLATPCTASLPGSFIHGILQARVLEWVHKFKQIPRCAKGQGSLVCYSSWGCKSWAQLSDWTTNVWMWEMSHNEGWAAKTWPFWTVVLEKTLESPLDSKEIKPVSPKGNQPWIFKGLMLKLKLQYFVRLLWRARLTGKDSDAKKNWRQEESWATEDEMVGWHHWRNGLECEQTQGDSEGQGSLACCSPWDHKESDPTQQLNNNYQ